jgi:GntR family transcriptional repressor for pyruvate dehydrogenase complex
MTQPRSIAPRPRRSRSLTQMLVDSMTSRIRRRELKAGDKLPTESEIMAAYGVSRTVVREAISRLQAGGLVDTRQGVGTFVLEGAAQGPFRVDPAQIATIKEVIALLELRIALEAEAAALAASRRTASDLAEMRRALDAFAHGIDESGDAVNPDFEFHLQIALASGNPHFADLLSHLGTLVIPRTRVNTARLAQEERSEYLRRVGREHEDIYDAIARGDADAARAAMRTHLSNSRERLRRAHETADSPIGLLVR